jgi:hypothetical protein
MNFEGLDVFFDINFCFPQHSCELGANFAENVPRSLNATEQAASVLWAWPTGQP